MKILFHLILVVTSYAALSAQVPTNGLRLWLRADTLVRLGTNGFVSGWGNLADTNSAAVPGGASIVTVDTINGRPAIKLRGDAYMEAPSLMPVRADYTLIVVLRIDDVSATNNIVSGNNRAFWLGSNVYPRVLHAGNFGQQAVSSIGIDGATVLRVRYDEGTRVARIDVNNQPGAADPVPSNTDSVIYLGAYTRGNFLKGRIAEVLLFDREVEGAELQSIDTYLHTRYRIPHVPDPPAPWITFTQLPKDLQVSSCASDLIVEGRVVREGIVRLEASVSALGERVALQTIDEPSLDTVVRLEAPLTGAPATFDVLITVDTVDRSAPGGRVVTDTVLHRRGIMCGEAISINGQSNSIWGGTTMAASPWARTFGGNFSQQRADTTFKTSVATGTGGGANVGAWGLWLQNAVADSMSTATLVINGGVGGTRIEQHLPDASDRLNLRTIYGSWLYRVIESGARDRIRWLFWYQGESNGGTDDYLTLFDQLRSAWHDDLPSLQHIVVIQIRPGCGPAGHTRIRDMQRQLEGRYPDVLVHAAAGLPGHDGCHYTPNGYFTLGQQLFDLYRINELSMMPAPYMSAPTIDGAQCVDGSCTSVRISFRRGEGLRMTADTMIGGAMRRASDAFFANGADTLRPRSVDVDASTGTVMLQFDRRVQTVSYIPDKFYPGTEVVYEGPWLVTEGGVGALTFHDVPVEPTSVFAFDAQGERRLQSDATTFVVLDVRGRIVAMDRETFGGLPSGVYIVRDGNEVRRMCITN